jgi:alkanesulfonate monooxygenase SsuD/methylene tetrahydromethanopterin reductase-like flavin-dependent oxidoreductase (luciferase family)
MTEEARNRSEGRRVGRGLYVAPFDELADPRALVALAVQAEEHGWDGFFLWDHILYRPPVRAVADPGWP